MASPGNSNQAGGPFDRTQFFNLPFPNPILQNPSNGNLTSSPFPQPSSYPLPPSTSYPPLTRPYSYTPPPTQFLHRQYPHPVTNLHQQRSSVSYPAPPLQPPFQNYNAGAKLMAILGAQQPAFEISHPPAVPPIQPLSHGYSEFSMPPNIPQLNSMPNFNSTMIAHPDPMRMPSSKLPTGRHLIGDHVVYDIDSKLEGEAHPQLEVTPITKYGSDPGLVLGRRIAVNKTYICYGLKMGAVRVLNMNTALRSLLKGLTQRVTDMAFFAEDVHLLASASVDGRVYVWKITEGPDEEDTPQITGNIVIAIQIVEGESVHPRVCWHCHKQEVLVVGIGKRVLRIDTAKVGKGEAGLEEVPIVCDIDNLIDGVHHVGEHEGEVTDLSMCQWMTTRVVSASTDGTIKIWEDSRQQPLVVLRPHDGQPVNSVTFLTANHRPDHIVLITGGPMNREVKIWTVAGAEDWLLPSVGEAWHCTQTLVLKSSAESRVEESFFNQVVALSQPGLLLLANAKKNAIYAVHFQYGPNPAATRMDYIAEFTLAMPILSFTGTVDLLSQGEDIVQVYCVQTQAIQQYGLDLSQCLPPHLENMVLEKSDSIVLHEATTTEGFPTSEPSGSKSTEIPLASSAPKLSLHGSRPGNAHIMRHIASSGSMEATTSVDFVTLSLESRPIALPTVTSNIDIDISCVASTPLPLCPRLSKTHFALRSPTTGFEPGPVVDDHGGDPHILEYSVDRQMDTVVSTLSSIPSLDDDTKNDENEVVRDDISPRPISFKHPTHLVTPSEILMASSSSEIDYVTTVHKSEGEENIQDVAVNSDIGSSDERNVEVDVKVVGDTRFSHNPIGSQGAASPNPVRGYKERVFYTPASDLGIEMAKEDCALSFHTCNVEESRQLDGSNAYEALAQASNAEEEVLDSVKDISGKNVASVTPAAALQQVAPITKWKKQKGKNAQGSGPSSLSPSAFNSADSSSGPVVSSSIPSAEAVFTQVMKMQEILSQFTTMQKEMQKQMTMMASDPVSREGRRLETSLGRNTEKTVKANCDALWARFQEENTKQEEKSARERTQEITGLVTNCINKDLPTLVEKTLKKELCGVGPNVAHTIAPVIEKAASVAIAVAFQRGVGDKAVYQLEKSVSSKLDVAVARQIHAQFQTSGKQALQDSLKTSLEVSVIPALEMSCKAMFEQVDATFQKGMVEHTTAAQQQFDSTHSPLALALRDAITSVSSMTQTLSRELGDGQRKMLGLAANSKVVNPLVSQWSNGLLGGLHDKIEEQPWDPAKELSRLVSEHKYEEAFNVALQRSDVSIVSWLCSQIDLQRTLWMIPLPLSQGVLLSLLQQLACDVSNDMSRKLAWMTDVAVAINPADPMIAMHVRPIFEQVYQIVNNHHGLHTTSSADLTAIRLVMHVINSLLMTTCK